MEKRSFILGLTSIVFVLHASNGEFRWRGICSWMFYQNSSCPKTNFLCKNGPCIDRERYCDGTKHCSDNSDERHCNDYNLICPSGMSRCPGEPKCIDNEWICNGVEDCKNGNDEKQCEKKSDKMPIMKALKWLNKQKITQSATSMWGSFVDKAAVVLYLASNTSTSAGRETRKEMTYEVSIQLLSRLLKKKLADIPSTDLASYLDAFLVTCLDPRKFHGLDIVLELRSRVNNQIYTNPYVLLSLCNAGETMTKTDKTKLIDAFRAKRRASWTDVQAVAVMALACASRQPGNIVDSETLRELTMELKEHQYTNGTVENLQTTALVLQAIFSAEPEADPNSFDETKAMQQILAMQEDDGSFGSFQNTYYVLPVLNCRSLVNISSDHCDHSSRDGNNVLEDLANRNGPKIRVRYSLWIGNDRDLERYLALRVPSNLTFYEVMEMAAEIDSRYRFEYIVKNYKPYVNAISGFQDDPEKGKFWFVYTFDEGKPTPSEESPVDIVPKDNEHIVMWYRSGTWTSE